MKVVPLLSSVLLTVASQSFLNVPGIDDWQRALDAHAAAEGRLAGITEQPAQLSSQFPQQLPSQLPQQLSGLPAWKRHQASVLAAERALESTAGPSLQRNIDSLSVFSLPSTTSSFQPSPAPSFTPSAPSPTSARSSSSTPVAETFKNVATLTKFIEEIQNDKKQGKTSEIAVISNLINNGNGIVAKKPDLKDLLKSENLKPKGSETFLDKLLDSFTTETTPKPKETTNSLDQLLGFLKGTKETTTATTTTTTTTTEKPRSSLAELLGLVDKKKTEKTTKKPRSSLSDIIALLEGGGEEKTTEAPTVENSLNDILRLLSREKPATTTTPKTTTTSSLDLSIAEILRFIGGEENKPTKKKNKPETELDQEIDEFLDILQQIDPTLVTNEVQPSEKESVRSQSVGNKIKSSFIEEELTSAAEESEQLNAELADLLEQLEG